MDATDEDGPQVLDPSRQEGILNLLGADRLRQQVRRLGEMATAAFPDGVAADRDEAHALANQAEPLGFMALGRACRGLEAAVKHGGDVPAALGAARDARDVALDCIAAWISQEADPRAAASTASALFRTPSALNSPAT